MQQRKFLRAMLCISLFTGYQGSIITQAISFAVDEFGATKAEQGRALAFIRFDIVLTLVLVKLGDRLGRRRMLLTCAIIGPVLTAASSLAPSLLALAGMQVISRSFVTATAVLSAVMGVEQMPAAARGWASSMLVGVAAIGSALLFIPLAFADSSETFWRYMFLPPLLGLLAVTAVKRFIPESQRFAELEARRERGIADARLQTYLGRLGVIAAWLILMGIFSTPSRQFLNDYLREERSFSSGQLTLFGVLTNVPGILGVLLGGAVSDRFGRKATVGWGLIGFGIATGAQYLSSGPTMWIAAMVASLFGAFALPGLGILVPELFPTALRSQASGISTGFNRIGSFIGLFTVGLFSDRFNVGPTLGVMSISVILGAIVVLRFVAEPAGRELETLNPEDGPAQDARPSIQSFTT
jgi:MFS transporter, AAHS family, 3-hydroxyphenylpropionic acid transporter